MTHIRQEFAFRSIRRFRCLSSSLQNLLCLLVCRDVVRHLQQVGCATALIQHRTLYGEEPHRLTASIYPHLLRDAHFGTRLEHLAIFLLRASYLRRIQRQIAISLADDLLRALTELLTQSLVDQRVAALAV